MWEKIRKHHAVTKNRTTNVFHVFFGRTKKYRNFQGENFLCPPGQNRTFFLGWGVRIYGFTDSFNHNFVPKFVKRYRSFSQKTKIQNQWKKVCFPFLCFFQKKLQVDKKQGVQEKNYFQIDFTRLLFKIKNFSIG